ncbi:N,N-dimethylformamidase beta subunit family domain-containing protein [Bacillus sp. J33]|uniref:N,N-dimethylformamidase beta subunit family domain-containing protein n=1 Tax=Bacillus sp. J33 TaxID=935836 RepID=UPI000687DE56|nr:N,N-dimethylformamidase beta subunit family domain-containing protein [Bacillus sp. J33]
MKKRLLCFLLSLMFLALISDQQTLAAEERVGGKDRFEVAVNLSKKGWPNGSKTVILTNYLAFADALSAAPFAYQLDSPILLTQPAKLTASTKTEILRLKPQKIILVGGKGSLNDGLIKELKAVGIPVVERIGGKDRFEVSKNIAGKMPPSEGAVIAYGMNFPDALAVAPYAARSGYPILLTGKDSLPPVISETIKQRNIQHSIIVGGEGSVGKTVADALPNVQRIGGKDRFEVANNIFKILNPGSKKVYISNGLTFADALTGSVLAAKENASMLLTWPTRVPDIIQNTLIDKMITETLVLGGTGSVGNGIIYLPGQWEMKNWAGYGLQGYSSKTSVLPNESITFYINSLQNYHIEFYRMGYYENKGAELKGTLTGRKAHIQHKPIKQDTLDANWDPSVTYSIPSGWESGVYLAKIVNQEKKASFIPFVVRDINPKADFMVLIATNTYQAYNNWGGKSLYGYNSTNKEAAVKLSFNRPYKNYWGAGEFFTYEYNLIRWLEKKGYNLTYITDTDLHEGILSSSDIKTLIIAGHDEYWSKQMRDHVEDSQDVNLAMFNANIGYWQVRLENENRTLVGYKYRAAEDPFNKTDPVQVTTRFRDDPVNRPEELLFGTMYRGIPEKTMPLVVTNSKHWIYEGTSLKDGDKIVGIVGGEVDRSDLTSGIEHIARSPVTLYGKPSVADVIWYNKPDGRKVFSVGTFYWNYFLDPYGHQDKGRYDKNIEIMTINALERLK